MKLRDKSRGSATTKQRSNNVGGLLRMGSPSRSHPRSYSRIPQLPWADWAHPVVGKHGICCRLAVDFLDEFDHLRLALGQYLAAFPIRPIEVPVGIEYLVETVLAPSHWVAGN